MTPYGLVALTVQFRVGAGGAGTAGAEIERTVAGIPIAAENVPPSTDAFSAFATAMSSSRLSAALYGIVGAGVGGANGSEGLGGGVVSESSASISSGPLSPVMSAAVGAGDVLAQPHVVQRDGYRRGVRPQKPRSVQ